MKLKLLHEATKLSDPVSSYEILVSEALIIIGKEIENHDPTYSASSPSYVIDRYHDELPIKIAVRTSLRTKTVWAQTKEIKWPRFVVRIICKPSEFPAMEVQESDGHDYFLLYSYNYGDDLGGLIEAIDKRRDEILSKPEGED